MLTRSTGARQAATPRRKPRILTRSAASAAASGILLCGFILIAGCNTPSKANIALRKELQAANDRIDSLTRQHAADAASLSATTQSVTASIITADQASGLFTTHGIRLGRLTGVDRDGFNIHLIPTDDDGNDFKAAGSLKVVADHVLKNGVIAASIAHEWRFPVEQSRTMWNGTGLRYEYVIRCPLPAADSQGRWRLQVAFTDALTGRSFSTSGEYGGDGRFDAR